MLCHQASFHVSWALLHAKYIMGTSSTSEPYVVCTSDVLRMSCDAGLYIFDYKGLRADHMV